MTTIFVRPVELRQISDQLRASAKKVGTALQAIDNDIASVKGDKFLGQRADALQAHYASKREALLKAREIVARFAEDLQMAATVFEKADQSGSATLPDSGGIWGGGGFPSLPSLRLDTLRPHILPYLVVPRDLILSIPNWLQSKLDGIFRPAEIVSPLGNEMVHSTAEGDAGRAASAPPEQAVVVDSQATTPEIAASTKSAVDVSFKIPVKAQGSLYGSAACSPTSVSMVLDYYSAQNAHNKTVSPEDLIGMMDKGDGTYGKGMSLSNLTDELNELGYKNITQQVGAQYADLRSAVKDGPIIVTSGVKIVGPGTVDASTTVRTLDGPGNTIHAMVVTGVGDDQVNINDPWSGQQMQLSRNTFEKMWSRGGSGIYSIRP